MNSQKTVLVVDDEAKITEVLEAYLGKAGYHTVSAGSGPEALRLSLHRKARRKPPPPPHSCQR